MSAAPKTLPKMPKKHPKLKLDLTAELDHDFERFSTGNMRMTMHRCEIKRGEEMVGYVAAVIPAGVVVAIGRRSYFISPQALWDAVKEADAAASTTEPGAKGV